MESLKNGDKLKQIFWEGDARVLVGEGGCESITVVMENGQMAGVPWAEAHFKEAELTRYNLALCEGVMFLAEPTQPKEG